MLTYASGGIHTTDMATNENLQIEKANAFSHAFDTLRDMSEESFIDESRIRRIKQLGAGAFATGAVSGSNTPS